MPSTEERLEAALVRMERLERQIEDLKRPRREAKALKDVEAHGGIIVNRQARRITVVSQPKDKISTKSTKGRFWQHVAFNQ